MEDGVVSDESLLRATRSKKSKSKSKAEQSSEHDDIGEDAPIFDELSIMKDFCKWKATWKDFKEQVTSETADLRDRNRQLRDDLFAAMRKNRLSITFLAEAAVRTDDLPRYVRINKTTSTRVINIDTI